MGILNLLLRSLIIVGSLLAELVMLLVYFGVFMPLGLLCRIAGREQLVLKRDEQATTYWQKKAPVLTKLTRG